MSAKRRGCVDCGMLFGKHQPSCPREDRNRAALVKLAEAANESVQKHAREIAREANAKWRAEESARFRLIAAAPSLLSSLKEVVAQLDAAAARLKSVEHFESFARDTELVANCARRVVARAEGR